MAVKKSTTAAKKPAAKKPAAKKPAAKKTTKPSEYNDKLLSPETILEDYDKLISDLINCEVKQRMANRPFRVYLVHRRRAEVMRLNFVKSIR